jgi:hypothetical protein
MGVRNDHHGQLSDAIARQKRNNHPAAGIVLVAPRPSVDYHPTSSRCPKDGTIALPYVEKM